MSHPYMPLPLSTLRKPFGYFQPSQEMPTNVTMDSPAVLVMTDLRQVTAVTIEPNVTITWALQRMHDSSVRLLLVTQPRNKVIGLITSTDIQGEKPLRLVQEMGGRHEDILVREIMTSYEDLDVLQMDDVLRSSIGDVVATLKRVGRRHALVVDRDRATRRNAIRGIFSATQIGKQLGVPIETVEVANTFAEMEMALNS